MGLQISGLISGLDTTSIVEQLMQVEANPQTLLKNQLVAVKADAAAYRAVNTRFAALQTAATALTDASTWTATKATSSHSTVAATSGASAVPGSLTFTVSQLAANHSLISGSAWGATDAAFGASSVDVTVGGTTTSIAIGGTGTLADAVAAINASDQGLTAAPVQVAPGQYRLQVTAKNSGQDAAFTLADGVHTFGVVTAGADALLTVGTGPAAYTARSATNTFSGLMPDTTITVSEANATTTVSVNKDPNAVAAKVQAMVDATNSLLDAISSYTDADSTSAVLKGDSMLRGYASRLLDTVSSGLNGRSLSSVGIEVTKDGKLTVDSATFTARLAADPTGAQEMFTKTTMVNAGPDGIAGNADDTTSPVGLAAQLIAMTKGATDTTTGTLVTMANSEDSLAKDLQARIDDWDTRLAMRKDTLTAQFTAMTTALSSLQNQQSWLTSQLNSLPGWSSSSSNKS